MLISVLVPCYNVENYVKTCLESIRRQTHTQLEVICLDDGSTDATATILDEYAASDSRFHVLHKPNTGYGDTMNQGLSMCTGQYVGIVESDDWIEPDMYECMLAAAQQYDADHVRCLWYEGPKGTERVRKWRDVMKNTPFCPLDMTDIFLTTPAIWAALYKRELLFSDEPIRFLPTSGASYQDASFAFKTYAQSKCMVVLNKPLHHYRINPNSSVKSTGKVLCLLDEWYEEMRWIGLHPALRRVMEADSLFAHIVYGGFRWNYGRLALRQKREFLHACSPTFWHFHKIGLFDFGKLKTTRWGRRLILTTYRPNRFFRYLARREKRRSIGRRIWNVITFKWLIK